MDTVGVVYSIIRFFAAFRLFRESQAASRARPASFETFATLAAGMD